MDQENELANQLAVTGIESTLLTDESQLANWPLAQQFDRIVMTPVEAPNEAASDPSETALAEFFADAIEQAALIKPGNMLWLHSQGLTGPWDAPYGMRCQFADEEDPDPPTFVASPTHHDSANELDPDVRLGYQQACAAQVVLIDQFVGILLDHIKKMPKTKQPLLVVTSPRGFPMGTGGQIGQASRSLFDDSIHVPFLVRWPDGRQSLNRHQGLKYASCIFDFVLNWFDEGRPGLNWVDHLLPDRQHEWLLAANDGQRCLRTHSWKYMDDGEQERLFVKPDDRWETNDVIRQCRMIGEELSELCQTMVGEILTDGDCLPRSLPKQLAENLS